MDGYWAALSKLRPRTASGGGGEPTTEKVACRMLRLAGVQSPSRQTLQLGGQVVHWSYGINWGIAAGVSRSLGVPLTRGMGLPFGAALWAFGDTWMLEKLKLAKPPSEYPLHVHASALGAHLIYGLTLWAVLTSLGRVQKPKSQLRRWAA